MRVSGVMWLGASAALLAVSGLALAENSTAALCVAGSTIPADLLIETCTGVIEAKEKLGPERAAAFEMRAEAFRQIGNKSRALDDDSAAIRLNPNSASLYAHRAALYVSSGLPGGLVKALADFDAALRLDPQFDVAVTGRKALVLEIEKIGAHMSLAPAAGKSVPPPR